MVDVGRLYDYLYASGIEFFTGVPDSQLKPFCDYVTGALGTGKQHIIAANEGNAVALAAGYHLATGKTALVYMQNSGLGNAVNPATSLTDPEVYGIPVLYMIGWRGQPGVKDEPQHIKQGRITLDLLKILDIEYYIITKNTSFEDVADIFDTKFKPLLSNGKSAAFVVEKNALISEAVRSYTNPYMLTREKVVQIIADHIGEDAVIVSTTGKTSRELFEYRMNTKAVHERDFLTVGSMGHASSIALSIAEHSDKKVWCLDGDGAMLMHMGALATIGSRKSENFYHILLNNGAHESVGGMPTIAMELDWMNLAKACGYRHAFRADSEEGLSVALSKLCGLQGPVLLEVMVSIQSREDLIRPTIKPVDNKKGFMRLFKQ